MASGYGYGGSVRRGGLCAIIVIMASAIVGPEGSGNGCVGLEKDLFARLFEGSQRVFETVAMDGYTDLGGGGAIEL
jgi:hypothetical protein